MEAKQSLRMRLKDSADFNYSYRTVLYRIYGHRFNSIVFPAKIVMASIQPTMMMTRNIKVNYFKITILVSK